MSWEPFVVHTSTEPTIDAVVRSRSQHWEKCLHEPCTLPACDLHPTPLVDRFDLIDPDQGFWRIVEPTK